MDDAKDGGACEDFPNAVYHFSKIGWDYNIERRVDGHWNSYLDWGFGDCMLRKMAEGKAFAHDDVEIAPGLTTIYLGGHAICSQAIRVETKSGPIIIGSDDFYRYDLMKNGVLARIYTQKEKLIESNGRLADWAIEGAVIIPVHDPVVLELCSKYGENWVEEARRLSREAGEGFRKHWPSAARP